MRKSNKIILYFAFILYSIFFYGQIEKIDLITGKWYEGQLDENNKVIEVNSRRGGIYSFTFKNDNSLTFQGAFNCGSGTVKKGIWVMDIQQNSIILKFNEIRGYINNRETKLIDEMTEYKILTLNTSELILSRTIEDKTYETYLLKKQK